MAGQIIESTYNCRRHSSNSSSFYFVCWQRIPTGYPSQTFVNNACNFQNYIGKNSKPSYYCYTYYILQVQEPHRMSYYPYSYPLQRHHT